MATKSVQFTIDVKGDSTGKQFKGVFKAKERLSMGDRLDIDTVRRNLVGSAKTDEVGPAANALAQVLSQLSVRLTDVPSWWSTARNGLDLEDENVIVEVYQAALKIESDAMAALVEAAEKDTKELKKPKKTEE